MNDTYLEYSATRIMGWRLGTTRSEGREWDTSAVFVEGENDLGKCDVYDCHSCLPGTMFGTTLMNVKDWRPDLDIHQLAMLIKHVDKERWFVLLAEHGIDRRVAVNSIENCEFWESCIYEPDIAFDAIIEAHQEAHARTK